MARLLAFASGLTGVIKLTKPIAELAAMLPWTGEVCAPIVHTMGQSVAR